MAEFAGDKDPRVIRGGPVGRRPDAQGEGRADPGAVAADPGGCPIALYEQQGRDGHRQHRPAERSSAVTAFEWGVAPAPNPPKGEKRHLHVWIDFWSMIKGVKNLQGAWEFMKFMISPEAQRIYPIQYGPQSARLSLGKDWLDVQKGRLKLSEAELGVMTEAPKTSRSTRRTGR